MPRIKIDNKIVINFNYASRKKYWGALSCYLISKYGNSNYTNQKKVEEILLDSFNYLLETFKQQISAEKKFTFFLYVHWLHEQSIQIHIKTLSGCKLEKLSESEFAMYRRILKLILEQGCEIDLDFGKFPTGNEVLRMDDKIQELIYLGTWLYAFADYIAFQKMIDECYQIYFDEQDLLVIEWQYHYGKTYQQLFPMLVEDYKKGTFDEQAVTELRSKIEECFNIKYNFAGGIIFEIQKQLSPQAPDMQTIEPDILPLNLVQEYGISLNLAKTFYAGLTISRDNKLTIENVILKPHSTKRYMFRPILVYKINGEDRALVGKQKFAESIMVLATNAIHWNAMFEEWLRLKCIQSFITKKGNEHDRILEDKIEEIVKAKGYLYCRNIKSFKRPLKQNNIRIDNQLAGEIDLIVVNPLLKKIYIADSKYNRARYEAVGYRTDNTNFTKSYEPQLRKKVNWISDNLDILQDHLNVIFNKEKINLKDYEVEGIFIINTPTFYMFNGKYKAITLKQFGDFIDGKYNYPDLYIIDKVEQGEKLMIIKHPYFKKPLLFNNDTLND